MTAKATFIASLAVVSLGLCFVLGRGSQISGAFRMPQSFWASVFLFMVFECVSPADWEGGGELEDHI